VSRVFINCLQDGDLQAQSRFVFSFKDGFANRAKNGESGYISKQLIKINACHKFLLQIRAISFLVNMLAKLSPLCFLRDFV
jgi:hypothetical protein